MTSPLAISSLYLALLGLMFIPFTLRVGAYRLRNNIPLGDGGDSELLKRIRAQANFVETVPLAILLITAMELAGAGSAWLHTLGTLLVIGRLSHYLQITGVLQPLAFRSGGMFMTLATYLVAPIWLLMHL
ncbi:MAG: MAPEG family protein [Pseudomonadales bacterium]